MTLTSYISWIPAYKLVINIFQKRGLGILRDIPQIDAFRIPDNVELTEFMEVKMTLEMNCVLESISCITYSAAAGRAASNTSILPRS